VVEACASIGWEWDYLFDILGTSNALAFLEVESGQRGKGDREGESQAEKGTGRFASDLSREMYSDASFEVENLQTRKGEKQTDAY